MSIFVPVRVSLGLGSTGGLRNDDLINSEDGDGGVSGELDGPVLGHEVIIDIKGIRGGNFLLLNINAMEFSVT